MERAFSSDAEPEKLEILAANASCFLQKLREAGIFISRCKS
jgi:hypothetical protein